MHAQLSTNSKAYSSDSTDYGSAPNTNISPISLGHPGTLPRPNHRVIEYAIRLGIACGCDIRELNEYARKNYFYADLPKGYQITQDDTPICTSGSIRIKDRDGNPKHIGLTRIHMEEDSGKSIHDQDPFNTLIDLNRAGVALLEIVSEPEIASSEEAYNYISEIRKLVRYLEICDGNMEEGSLRCDANISVRKKGVTKFGTKVEVKNMNSMRNVARAIEHEITRQIDCIENGGEIVQETRTFDALKGNTIVMRSKEEAHDYRYFTEPDLAPVRVDVGMIESVRKELPPLPDELYDKYTSTLGLSDYDARVIIEDKKVALYFEELLDHCSNAKNAANWLMGPIKSYLNSKAIAIDRFPLKPEKIAQIIELVETDKISNSIAEQRVFGLMMEFPEKSALELAQSNNLIQEKDEDSLHNWIAYALEAYPEKVVEYKNGKKGLLGLFMGEVMKISKGKADPKLTNQLLRNELDK